MDHNKLSKTAVNLKTTSLIQPLSHVYQDVQKISSVYIAQKCSGSAKITLASNPIQCNHSSLHTPIPESTVDRRNEIS